MAGNERRMQDGSMFVVQVGHDVVHGERQVVDPRISRFQDALIPDGFLSERVLITPEQIRERDLRALERSLALDSGQQELLEAVGTGMENSEIAATTGRLRAEQTVKNLLTDVFRVLGVSSRVDAARVQFLLELGNNRVNGDSERPSAYAGLSDRMKKMVHLVSLGLDNTEVADEMEMARSTAKNALTVAFSRLGVTSRTGAARAQFLHTASQMDQ